MSGAIVSMEHLWQVFFPSVLFFVFQCSKELQEGPVEPF